MYVFYNFIVVTVGLLLHSFCIFNVCIILLFIVYFHCILFISINACCFCLEIYCWFETYLYTLFFFSVYLFRDFVLKCFSVLSAMGHCFRWIWGYINLNYYLLLWRALVRVPLVFFLCSNVSILKWCTSLSTVFSTLEHACMIKLLYNSYLLCSKLLGLLLTFMKNIKI